MAKKYEELTFSDDFMFCKVLRNDPSLCRELLELLIGEPVGEIVRSDRQYPIEITPDGRGVRFDVYARDDRSVIYDVEMQNAKADSLPKRVRYSQSLIDADLLERGSNFRELNHSFVIFICRFNLWPDVGLHKYLFRNLCIGHPEVELGDEAEKLFLCTEGTAQDISENLLAFLKYVSEDIAEDAFTAKLQSAVTAAQRNPVWRKEYMDLRDYVDSARAEGLEEGLAEGYKLRAKKSDMEKRLIKTLLEEGRQADFEAVLVDQAKMDRLLAEYGLWTDEPPFSEISNRT